MINQEFRKMIEGKSVIREQSEYATARGREIGYENVFDFSLGNPSVPCPPEYTQAVVDLHLREDPMVLHGYSPSQSLPSTRAAVAESLNRRFGMDYRMEHIFMTSGATGAIAHALRCVTCPGEQVLTFAPYFGEYGPYVAGTGAELKVVPADTESFQINFDAFEKAMNPKVAAVLLNTPNNPSGVVYSTDTIRRLARVLTEKQREYGHDIFLVSDEPYREIVFEGTDAPFVSAFYDNSLCCYSFSKSLSLPGERIGYVAVNPRCTDADLMAVIFSQISRKTGHNCPSSSVQLAVERVLDKTSDLSVYERNRDLIYDELVKLGFRVVRPGGTFYIFPQALEEDDVAFCEKAKKYDLIFVPGSAFGCPGYFRMAYCIGTEKVLRSFPVLERFVREEYGAGR